MKYMSGIFNAELIFSELRIFSTFIPLITLS